MRPPRIFGLTNLVVISFLAAACSSDEPADAPADSAPPRTSRSEQAVWTNGDFENDAIGTTPPSGWTLTTNLNNGITDTRPSPQTLASLNLATGGVSFTAVVGGSTETQTDPDLGLNGTLRFPKYGTRAARINATGIATGLNRNVNTLKQTMTATIGDVDVADNKVHIRFAIAPILENPAHTYVSQPYYFVRVQNLTKNLTIYTDFNISGQTGVPWKSFTDASGNSAQYTDWMLVDVAPGDAQLAVGDQVELQVIAAGCSQGGHWGRVYVDAVGSGVPGLFAYATGPQQVNAGSTITYTINYKNGGTSNATTTKLDLVIPPSTTFNSVSLGGACTAPAAGGTGTVSCSLGTLPPGGTGSFTVTVNVPAGTATGTVVTNGNYSIYATGINALIGPKVNTTVTSGATYADLGVTMSDGVAAIGAGQSTTYTLTATNNGPSAASTVTVTNTMPSQLSSMSWTCSGTGGGICTPSGNGSISDASVQLPVGATVRYIISATVSGSATGNVVNTATVAVGGSVTDPDTTNNTAVDTNAIGTLRTLTVTKTGSTAAGSVSSTPAAISCGTSCTSASGQFLDGSQVQLTATPVAGAVFNGWGGACSGTATTCTVTMSAAQSVTAQFTGPTISIASGNNQTATVNNLYLFPLSVVVRDGNGNAINGAVVTFTAPATGASATVSSPTATTNILGQAQTNVTANNTAGTFQVTASFPGATPVQFTLTNQGDPSQVTVSSGSPQTTVVTTAFGQALVALVRDNNNQPVGGVTVTFAVPATGASATLSSTTAVTDANGLASVTATANTLAGTYNATATVGLLTPANFALTNTPGAPANLSLIAPTARSATVNTTQGTFTVEITDAFGNVVPGVTVGFTAPASGASATLSAASAVTGSNGRASVTGLANTVAGSYSIVASATGVTSKSFSVTNNPGAATTMTVVSGNNQTTGISTAFASPLVVVLRDTFGNPVPGATVTFTPPASGASATVTTTVTTDAGGQAQTNATANSTAGTYNVVASATGVTSQSFSLTNTPGAPASIGVVSGGTQSTQVTTAFGAPLVVRVADASNNPVSGVTVTFTRPASGASATLSVTSVITGANGQAQVTATANTITGTYNVTAAAAGVATPATFALTNTPGAATTLTLIAPTTRSATVGTTQGTFTVEVTDAQGNLVPGVTVTFTAPASGASTTLSATSAVTGANGRASVTGIANSTAGTYSITASATGTTSQAFTVTNNPGSPSTVTIVSGTPQSATVGTAYAALVVRVRDAFGNNIPGVSVAFAAPASGASATVPATVTTDASGLASASATANTVAGTYNVSASVSGLAAVNFALTNTAGAPAAISVVSGGTQSTQVTTAFGAALVVRVADASNNPISGVTVTFTRPVSGASATLSSTTVTTGANGQAQTSATANATAGTYNVTAAVSGVSTPATFALTNTPGAAATMAIVSGNNQSTTVGTAFAPLVVVLRDANNNPVPGATVTFTAPASGASAAVTTTVTTDASGQASTPATANSTAGTYNVTAAATGVTSQSFSLTNTAGAPAAISVVSGGTQSTQVTTAFGAPLVVRVADASNNPVSGVTVTFTRPASGASATLSSTTVTTGANGQAQVTATANTITGTYNVTAAVTGVATPATFALTNTPGAATTLTLIAPTTRSATVGTTQGTFTVEVTDANGNLVPGVTVGFTAPASGASATLSAASAVTGANGRASITGTANTVAGTYSVTASATGTTSQAFTVTNNPGAAATLTVVSGTPQSTTAGSAFAAPLVVRVRDAFGNNISGVSVAFAAPASGASATVPATVTTDASGLASASATANTVAGTYNVSASTSGVASPVTFALTNNPGAAAAISVVSGGTQSTQVTTAFGAALVVRVADANNNPISGVTVTFTRPASGASATLSSTTVTTGANGQAQVTATANTVAGTYNVTAAVTGVATPATFALTNTPGAATTLTLIAPTTRSATVGTTQGSFVVEATDAQGNVVPGVTVNFAAPASGASATLSAASAVTGANGRATITGTANTVAGTYSITASSTGLTSRTFTVTNNPGAAATLTLVSGTPQSATIETAFAAPLVVRVRDSFGNNIPGVSVAFAAPASGASATVPATVTTDAGGLASASATANTVAGTYNVSASTSGVASPVTFALTNNPGAAAAITLVAPTTRSATVGTTLGTFTAQVSDARGNPIPNFNLTFSAPATGASAALSATTGTTGANGQATFTATANTVAGPYNITVSGAGLSSQSFAITNTPGAAATLAIVSGTPQSATIETAFAPLVARVRDSFGNNVAGVTVTFAAPASGATAGLGSTSVTTDNNGVAQTSATAGTVTGTYNVTASASGLSTISYALTNTPGAPANLVLIAPTTRTATVGSPLGTFTAEVTDARGNVIPGATVTFSAPATGASATLSAPSATTGSDGRASITAAANSTAGSFSITASVAGVAPQTFSITTTPGAPASFVIVSGSPQSVTVDAAFAPLVVRVRDAFGNNIPDAPVAFTAPATGATAILGTVSTTTDAGGLAQTTATAGATAGSYSVTATTLGLPNLSFSLTNTPGAPVAVQVNAGDDQSAEVTTAFAQPLSVTVVDSHGNPVPGVTVTFAPPAAGASAALSATTVTTGANGRAQVTATANPLAGQYAVNATIAGATAPAVFDLTNTPGAPATIAIVGGNNQSAEIEGTFAAPLRVEVRDAQGNVVPGASVTFTAPATGASAAVDGTVTTDVNGVASSAAVANAIAGAYEVTAAVDGVALPVVFDLTNTPGAATTISISDGDNQETQVDTVFARPLEVLVTDRGGNPVTGATVRFTAPGTSPSAQLSQSAVTTDATGHASVTAEADFRSGAYQVTAELAADVDVAFSLRNLPGAPAQILAAPTSTPQSGTVLDEYAEPLVAQVVDRFGNPVPGATVTFAVPATGASASLSTLTAITDANGNVSVIATANGTAGSYLVNASVPGAANPAPFQLTNLAGAPTLVSIEAGDAQTTEVDTDFAQRLVVKVVDAQGNPVPGAIVSFEASTDPATAILSASAVATGSDGLASVSARASTTSGSHQVRAVVIGAATPVIFDLTNTPGAPAAVTADLGATPQQAQVNTPYLRALLVHVVDRFGNPVPNTAVTFAAPATGATGALSATTATSDGDGDAQVFVTAGTVTGNFEVTATVNGVALPASFDLTNLPGSAHRLVVVSGDEQSTVVDTAFATQLVARVVDEFDNPVPGTTVTFEAPASPATASLSPLTVITDAQGLARTTATASTVTGEYDVVAISQLGAAPILFELTNTPDAPFRAVPAPGATPQIGEVRRGFGAPLEVIVTDRFGNRVPGAVIDFTTVAGPGAALSAPRATTGADGTASVLAIADGVAGSYQVTAQVSGIAAPVIFELTNSSAAPAYIVIDSGDGQSTLATTAYGAPLVLRVLDNFGNPVPGIALNLAMTRTGPSAQMTTSTNVSDAGGYVRYTLVANGVPGQFAVTATATGAAGMAVAVFQITAIPTTTTVELPAAVSIDQKVRVGIKVTGQLGTPTGTVELFDAEGKMIGTAELASGSGEAFVQLPALGEHTVTARYAAQGSFAASESTAGTVEATEDEGSLNGTTCSAGGGAGGMLPMMIAMVMMIGWRRRERMARMIKVARPAKTPPAVMAVMAVMVGALALLHAGDARAQVDESSRAVNRFHAASAESAWIVGDSLEFEGHGGVAIGVTGDYGYRPLVVYNAGDDTRTVVVKNSLLAHFNASVTLKQKLRISASAPMALYQDGDDGMFNGSMLPAPQFALAFGDMYLAGDYRVVGGPRSALRVAVGVRFTLPTGMRTDYMSDSKFAFEPRASMAMSRGRVELAAALGAFLRGASDLATEDFGSELRYTASAGFRLGREQRLLLGPEIIGALPLSGSSDTGYPTEVGAGLHYRTKDQLQLSLGVNTGVVNAVGVPQVRVFLGMAWAVR